MPHIRAPRRSTLQPEGVMERVKSMFETAATAGAWEWSRRLLPGSPSVTTVGMPNTFTRELTPDSYGHRPQEPDGVRPGGAGCAGTMT